MLGKLTDSKKGTSHFYTASIIQPLDFMEMSQLNANVKSINEYVAKPARSILKGYHITWNWDASHCEVKAKKVPKEAQ